MAPLLTPGPRPHSREGTCLSLRLAFLALGSWFWLPHRDTENRNIPGIHYGNRAPTLAVKRTRGSFQKPGGGCVNRVPGAGWSPSHAPPLLVRAARANPSSRNPEPCPRPPSCLSACLGKASAPKSPTSPLTPHVHTLSPARGAPGLPKGPRLCVADPLELCNREIPVPPSLYLTSLPLGGACRFFGG